MVDESRAIRTLRVMDTDYFPDIMRVLAELPEALDRLGDRDAAERFRKSVQRFLMELVQELRSQRVTEADQLLSDAHYILEANYVEQCPGDTASWLDFLSRTFTGLVSERADNSTQ
jgi:hypothetical protein